MSEKIKSYELSTMPSTLRLLSRAEHYKEQGNVVGGGFILCGFLFLMLGIFGGRVDHISSYSVAIFMVAGAFFIGGVIRHENCRRADKFLQQYRYANPGSARSMSLLISACLVKGLSGFFSLTPENLLVKVAAYSYLARYPTHILTPRHRAYPQKRADADELALIIEDLFKYEDCGVNLWKLVLSGNDNMERNFTIMRDTLNTLSKIDGGLEMAELLAEGRLGELRPVPVGGPYDIYEEIPIMIKDIVSVTKATLSRSEIVRDY